MQDVALLAVRVVQEREARRAVRVVLDGRNLRRNALLLAAKIDRAVLLLVAAAAMPDGDLAVRVASARALLRLDERLLRRLLGDLALIEHGQEAPRRGVRIKCFQCHNVDSLPPRGTLRGPQPAGPCGRSRPPPKPRATDQHYRLSAYSIIFSPAASLT